MSAELVTVLHTTDGRSAQKIFRYGQASMPYQAGTMFTFERRIIRSLHEFAAYLAELEQNPTAFIIRGQPLPHVDDSAVVYRRCRGEGAAFTQSLTQLVCVDVDNVEAPLGISPCSDEAVEHVIGRLPAEFHNSSYVRQFSSSAGLSGQKVKVHLWWWFDRGYGDQELRRWAEATPEADAKLFNPVQPHYTAAPFFDGVDDPFQGKSRVALVVKSAAPVSLNVPEYYSVPQALSLDSVEVVRDDNGKAKDGRETLLRDIRWRVLQKRHPKTLDEYVQMVWEEFKGAAHLTPTSHSSHSYLEEDVARGCARDWDRWGKIVDTKECRALCATAASIRMKNEVRKALTTRGNTAIRATPGLGKSVATAAELVALPDIEKLYVEIYAPTRKQQAEWCDRLNAAASKANKKLLVQPIFGRDLENCAKNDLATELARNEIPVTPSLCEGKLNGQRTRCEHFDTCIYRAQFANKEPGIRVFSHAHLATPRPKQFRTPELIVIDEAFALSLIDISDARLTAALRTALACLDAPLRRARSSAEIMSAMPDARMTLMQVIKSIYAKTALLDELRARGITPELLASAARVISARAPLPGIHPGKSVEEMRVEITRNKNAHCAMAIRALRALSVELYSGRSMSHSVKWVDQRNDAKLCVLKNAQRLRDIETILILDADFEPEIAGAILPRINCVTIDARQNARFIQIEDRSFSKTYLGLKPGADAKESLITEIASQVRSIPGRRKLVVSYKSFIPTLRKLLPGFRFVHFGGLRGTNDFEDCDAAIILGRHFPPADAIEDIARALHCASSQALILSPPIPRRHAVGKGVLRSYDFIDCRMQAVLRSMREAETRQAIGRLRLVHSREPKGVYIYSSQPVGIAVDKLIAFEPGKAELVFEKLGGMLPSNPADLVRLAGPELFPQGEKQAKEWRDKVTKTGASILDLSMRRSVLVASTCYRRRHKLGRSSTVHVSALDHPCPERSLPKLLAAPGENPDDIVVQPLPWEEVRNDPRVPDCIAVFRLRKDAA